MTSETTTKRCANPECTVKPIEDFYRASKSRDGHGSYCKSCDNARNLKRHQTPDGKLKKAKASRRHRAARLKAGLCVMCGKRRENRKKQRCNSCAPKGNAKAMVRAARVSDARLCLGCSQPPMPTSTHKTPLCETCYLKRLACKLVGTVAEWKELKQRLEIQGARCAYTGQQIILGINDSLVPIYPPKRFAREAGLIRNYEWALRDIARMKGDTTRAEFLGLLSQILGYSRQ